MLRRKKSSSGRSSRRKRPDSSSPVRRRGSDAVNPPPEFAPYDYEKLAIYLMKAIGGQHYPFLSNGFVHLIHELEAMMATNHFTKEFMTGEAQFINEGFYPTPDLNARLMPVYDLMPEELTPSPSSHSDADARIRESSNLHDEEKTEICLLPEEYEEDDWDTYVEHVGTCFWSWCRRTFMGKIDSEYLENFKETILDAYSSEALQKLFINEPWKYRRKAPPPPSSRRKSVNSASGKKKVSIATSEMVSPVTSRSNRKALSSLTGYRIPNRRHTEKESINNNKIVPMIGSMVLTACRELKEAKTPETPTTRRGRTRMASREESRERERKCAKIEVDVDEDDEICNGSSNRISPRLHSPRQVKKEKIDEEYERMELNGHSSTNGLVNGHSKSQVSPKRKNGDIRNWINGSKPSGSRKPTESNPEEVEGLSDIEDFDAKAIGSRIVAKLIAGGILTESSAHIFEQMTLGDDDEEAGVSVEMSEEGHEEAEDQEVGELAEELHNLQMSLRDEIPAKKALFMLTWRRAKAHFAFFHTFDELRRADYDLFKLGVNMYKEYPRKLPSNSDMPVLRESLQKRNHLARMHYSKMYRRQPKYRWHKAHVPAGKRTLV